MTANRLLRAAASSLVLFSTLACRPAPEPPPLLRLGYSPHDHHAPLYVAALAGERLRAAGAPYLSPGASRGEFLLVRDGRTVARVQLVPGPGGKELVRRLAEDQLDLGYGGFPAMVQQIDQGAPFRVVAPVMTGGSGLVVRRDLPADDWEAFVAQTHAPGRALRIGYRTDFAVQKLLFEQALKQARVRFGTDLDAPEARVVLVNLYGAENLIPSLRSGLVDGFVGVQPYLALAEEQGVGRVVSDLRDLPCGLAERCSTDQGCSYPCCALAARTDYLGAHPEVVEALVAMTFAGSRFLGEHPGDAADLVARWLGTTPAVERRSLATIQFLTQFEGPWDRGARQWVETMVRSGTLRGVVARASREGRLDDALTDRQAYSRLRKNHQP